MRKALQLGPVAIAIDGSARAWKWYSHGIIDDYCGANLNNGALVVGYGSETEKSGRVNDFWIIKTSNGVKWGEKGYARIWDDKVEGNIGPCGMLMDPFYPVV